MIKLEKVTKKFAKRLIFKDIDLMINKAGVYLIRGDNGIGKSTLLSIIGGILKCKGKVINNYTSEMGCLWQNSSLINHFTVKEHLELFNIELRMLNKYDLIGKENSYPIDLSDGERQRLGFILAMYNDNKLVLLDEPIANVDYKKSKLIKKEIIKHKKDKIIIIVSHNFKLFEDCLDGIISIDKNKIKYSKINDNDIVNSNKKKKRRLTKEYLKKERIMYKRKYIRLFSLGGILLLSIFLISLSQIIVYKMIDKDIENSVEYNKYYLRECEDIYNNGYKILKCDGVEEEKLKQLNIDYRYNYDYMLYYFYNDERLKVMDNENISLKEGRYPLNYNEVIASDDYKVGDKFNIESNIVLGNSIVDFYRDEIEIEVVGIYHKLNFNKDNNLYFDYDLINNYYENEYLINNEMNINEYYNSLDLGQYKYLTFEFIECEIELLGNKYQFYEGVRDIVNKIFELINNLKVFIIVLLIYSFIKINRTLVIDKQKSFGYLISNGYNKLNLLFHNLKLYIWVFSIIFSFFSLILIMLSKNLLIIKQLTFSYILLILACIYQYLFYFSKKKISNLMREEV